MASVLAKELLTSILLAATKTGDPVELALIVIGPFSFARIILFSTVFYDGPTL